MADPRYGWAHQQLRRRWQHTITTAGTPCWRCGQPIQPHMLWDLGHDDWDHTITHGPEHRHCNRSAAAHKKNGTLPPPQPRASRNW